MQKQTFPVQVFVEILKYLPFRDIYNLALLSKSSLKLIRGEQFKKMLFCRTLNLNFFKTLGFDINWETLYNQIQRGSCNDMQELPFWGESTDGGIYQNGLKYWIGTVVLKKPGSCHIVGYLADNYYNFVDNLMKAANFHRLYFTHHMGEISQRDLNIFMTFMTSFQIDSLAHPNQQFVNQYRQVRKQLLLYVMETTRQMEDIQDNIVCIPSNRLNMFACIFEVDISRNPTSNFNAIQELLILTKTTFSLTCPSQVTSLLFEKKDFWTQYMIKTNFSLQLKDEDSQYDYVIFKKNPMGILAWVDLKDSPIVHLKIPMQHRPWTNVVNLYIIKGRQYGAPGCLSLQYCSFKGILISNIY